MDGKDQRRENSKTINHGQGGCKRSAEITIEPFSAPFPSTNQLMASQSSNEGCSQFCSHVIEIPGDKVGYVVGRNRATIGRIERSSGAWIKIESGPCTPGTNRRVHLKGAREQIVSATRQIIGTIDRCPPGRVKPIPDPSYYGHINPLGMAARSYPGMPSESSQGSRAAPPILHGSNPIQAEAGIAFDEAWSCMG